MIRKKMGVGCGGKPAGGTERHRGLFTFNTLAGPFSLLAFFPVLSPGYSIPEKGEG